MDYRSILLDPNIDEKSWRMAAGMVLTDMYDDQQKVNIVLWGNGNPEKGLCTRLAALGREVKVKGSFWGIIGGGGMAAMLALAWILLKGHV